MVTQIKILGGTWKRVNIFTIIKRMKKSMSASQQENEAIFSALCRDSYDRVTEPPRSAFLRLRLPPDRRKSDSSVQFTR